MSKNKSEKAQTKASTKTSAAENRRKVALLYFLCQQAGIDIENELADIIPLIAKKLGESESFKATGSETLNWYKLCEKIPYNHVMREGDNITTFYDMSDSDIEQLLAETYVISVGHSLFGDIKDLIFELSRLAAPKNRKAFTDAKDKISAKVSESAKEVVQGTPDDDSHIELSSAENSKTSNESAPPITPEQTMVNSTAKTETARAYDPYMEAIELSAKEQLPVYFDQDIDKNKIEAGIYCNCRIHMRGKRKTSKRAVFIDCTLV